MLAAVPGPESGHILVQSAEEQLLDPAVQSRRILNQIDQLRAPCYAVCRPIGNKVRAKGQSRPRDLFADVAWSADDDLVTGLNQRLRWTDVRVDVPPLGDQGEGDLHGVSPLNRWNQVISASRRKQRPTSTSVAGSTAASSCTPSQSTYG